MHSPVMPKIICCQKYQECSQQKPDETVPTELITQSEYLAALIRSCCIPAVNNEEYLPSVSVLYPCLLLNHEFVYNAH